MVDTCTVKNEEATNNGYLFDTSECWDKSTEYYIGVSTPIGAAKYVAAQKDSACVSWADRMDKDCDSPH